MSKPPSVELQAAPPREITEAEFVAIREALAPVTAEADAPRDDGSAVPRVRPATVALLAIAGWLVVTAIAVRGDDGAGFAFLALIFGFFGVWRLVNDLGQPRKRALESSERVVHGYYRGAVKGLWAFALPLLSPIGRRITVRSPADAVFTRNNEDGLRQYWRSTTGVAQSDRTVWLRRLDVTPMDAAGDVHRYRVSVTLASCPTWVFFALFFVFLVGLIGYLIANRATTHVFDVVAYRHHSRWYVLTGELGCPADTEEGIEGIAQAAAQGLDPG